MRQFPTSRCLGLEPLMISVFLSMLLVQTGGRTCPGPWSFVCKLRDRAVGLTQTLQHVDGLASLSLKLLSALTHTWATSSSRGGGRTEGVGIPSVMLGSLHPKEKEALTATLVWGREKSVPNLRNEALGTSLK